MSRLYRRPHWRNSALHCEMLKITKISRQTATSYLATTTEQDAALCHGFVKKFLPDQMFLLGNPAGAFFKLNRLVTMCTCDCETTRAKRKCLSWPTFSPQRPLLTDVPVIQVILFNHSLLQVTGPGDSSCHTASSKAGVNAGLDWLDVSSCI